MDKGKSFWDAAERALMAHFDYSILPAWGMKARSANIQELPYWKMLGTPFLSFYMKVMEMVNNIVREAPVSGLAFIAAPTIIKHAIEAYQVRKNPKIKEYYRLTPEYLKNSSMLRYWSEDQKKMMFIPLEYFYPTGQLVSHLDEGLWGVVEGLSNMAGIGESPIGAIVGAKLGYDAYSKKPIFNQYLDSDMDKNLSRALYLYRTFLEPASATVIRTWATTQHPLTPRLFGLNRFDYTLDQLALIKKRELKTLQQELVREMFDLNRGKFDLGFKSKDEKINDLLDKYQERQRALTDTK